MIKSELYKTAHRPYVYILMGITCLLILFVVILTHLINPGFSIDNRVCYEEIVSILLTVLPIGVYFAVTFTDAVFSEEYKYQTMKNSLSFGMSRNSYYLGKLFTQMIVAIICMLAVFLVALGSAWIFLGTRDGITAAQITQLILTRMLLALPLWIGALCISNFLAFFIKSSTVYGIIYVLLFALGAPIINLLGKTVTPVFTQIHQWLIMPQFDVLNEASINTTQIIHCVVIGLGHGVIATLLGMGLFQKREIK